MPLVGLVAALLTTAAGAGRASTKPPAPPPVSLNVVHHRVKRGAVAAYQTLEASIVNAYDRAKIPLYWVAFVSTKDPRDVLYLNAFASADGLAQAADTYKSLVAPAHPELARMSTKLASMIETQASMLTTRRAETPYTRADVDLRTMRALALVTFHVKPGHEGKFMDAVRKAGGSGAPWMLYESTEDSTFVLLAPMRSRAEARHPAPIPRPIRELRGIYNRATTEAYVLMPSLSHQPPAGGRKSQPAVTKQHH